MSKLLSLRFENEMLDTFVLCVAKYEDGTTLSQRVMIKPYDHRFPRIHKADMLEAQRKMAYNAIMQQQR